MATADLSPSLSNSPAGAPLQSRLHLLARRRNAMKMRHALVRAAIPGVVVASLGVLAYKLHLIPDGPLWAPAAIIGASLLWGARNGLMERRGNFVAARDADATLNLDDRLSSALAFVAPDEVKRQKRVQGGATRFERVRNAVLPRFAISTAPTALTTNLVPALVSDASTRVVSLDPKQVYPSKFDRAHQILALAVVVFLGACFMPDIPLFLNQQDKIDRKTLMQQGEKLITVSKQIKKQVSPKAEEVQRLNQKLQKLGQKMARGRMTKRAALTEIGELKKELQKAKQRQESQGEKNSAGMPQIPEALREAPLQSKVGKEVQQDLLENKWDEAAKKLEETADRLEKGDMSEKEKQQAADDLDKVAQQLKQRGGQANQQAAKQLEQAAKQLRQNQGQQGQQQQNQNQSQDQQQQQGQQGQQNQQQGQQNQQQGQQGQQQQQKNGQGQQQQSGQGQQQQQKNGQQQQQQGGQGQQNQQQQQNSQGQQSQGGQGQQKQQQQGQQGQSGGQGQQQGQGQQGDSSASSALRDMANGLRQGGSQGNSGNLGQMLDKLREAEGSTNGSQAGQGNMKGFSPYGGKGGVPSPSQMKSLKPGMLRPTDGRGNNQGGAGLGPRDQSTGNKGGGISKYKKPNTGDKRRYEDVWSDRLPKTHAKLDRVTGKWGDQGEVDQLPTRGEAKGGNAKTPYYEVYESYKRDAEDAVSREAVPPAYKDSVKNYFESLKP